MELHLFIISFRVYTSVFYLLMFSHLKFIKHCFTAPSKSFAFHTSVFNSAGIAFSCEMKLGQDSTSMGWGVCPYRADLRRHHSSPLLITQRALQEQIPRFLSFSDFHIFCHLDFDPDLSSPLLSLPVLLIIFPTIFSSFLGMEIHSSWLLIFVYPVIFLSFLSIFRSLSQK